jgi:hypothetical protein
MRIVGILIAFGLLLLLFVWWMNISLGGAEQIMKMTPQVGNSPNVQNENTNPIDYSKDKLKQIESEEQKRIDQLNNPER